MNHHPVHRIISLCIGPVVQQLPPHVGYMHDVLEDIMARHTAKKAGSARKAPTVTISCTNCWSDLVKDLEDDSPPVCEDELECEHKLLLRNEERSAYYEEKRRRQGL